MFEEPGSHIGLDCAGVKRLVLAAYTKTIYEGGSDGSAIDLILLPRAVLGPVIERVGDGGFQFRGSKRL